MALFDKTDNFIEQRHIESKLVSCSFNKNRKPLVSILMPIYNHPQFFEIALRSCVNQSFSTYYEIIICDNNHPNYQKQNQAIVEKITGEINTSLENITIKYYINEKNIGGIGNWNRCIELASAPYVLFCHDDDLLTNDSLSILLKCRHKIKDKTAMIAGSFNTIDKNGDIIKSNDFKYKGRIHKAKLIDFFFRNITNGCGCLYERECLKQLGGFGKDYIPCPDYSLNINYCFHFKAYFTNEITFYYRVSEFGDSALCHDDTIVINKRIRDELTKKLFNSNAILIFLSNIMYKLNILVNKKVWNNDHFTIIMKVDYFLKLNIVRALKSILTFFFN